MLSDEKQFSNGYFTWKMATYSKTFYSRQLQLNDNYVDKII